MKFVVDYYRRDDPRRNTCFLAPSDWDDWFRYETTFVLSYVDEDGKRHSIGSVKIGQFGMGLGHGRDVEMSAEEGKRSPDLPQSFETLSPTKFFSLGQDADYYEALNELGAILRDEILIALCDLAVVEGLLDRASRERVTDVSLMRSVPRATVERQFRRIAHGGAKLTPYEFTYTPTRAARKKPPVLTFEVTPNSNPPTNIHVLIGRNGVGKTRALTHMTKALVAVRGDRDDAGTFEFWSESEDELSGGDDGFTRLVSVSFSAFDAMEPFGVRRGAEYVRIGLHRLPERGDRQRRFAPKTPGALAREFSLSVLACLQEDRLSRWRRALHQLEADPVFADADVSSLADEHLEDDEFRSSALDLFRNLSSGHKIVLLTITRLVENVEEKSLVLIDEPEGHLHPPLLSAFVRALSDLLVNRNGVAIIATHSPVVLQEVPRTCAWILRRSGRSLAGQRPAVETFGENVSVLTHEVFGLEVTKSGFHAVLTKLVEAGLSFDEILEQFDGQLGGEARGLVRGLIATQSTGGDR